MGDLALSDFSIHGVVVYPLKKIPDERGMVMQMVRADSPWFDQFGEVYFSLIYNGAIKAWRKHAKIVQHLVVPVGEIQLVLFDDRNDSPTRGKFQEMKIGINRYVLVKIPPGIWYGFQGVGVPVQANHSIVANYISHPYDPVEIERCPPTVDFIPYLWS